MTRVNVTLTNRDRAALGIPTVGRRVSTTRGVLDQRRREMLVLRETMTLAEIGSRYGITRQRVYQILRDG